MRYFGILLTLGVLCAINNAANTADAAPFTGSIGIQAPALTPDRLQEQTPQFCLDLNFPAVIGDLSLWGQWEHSLKDGALYERENKFRIGGDLPLAGHLGLYSFWERRYSTNDNRVVVGCRLNFCGRY